MSKGVVRAIKGGPGSGNWGHAGRPGLVGGSGGGAGMAMGAGQPSGGDSKKAHTFLNGATSRAWTDAPYKEQSDVKRAIISELAERSGVDEDTVNEVIKQWAETSNDNSLKALSLQEAAAEELGLKLSAWQQEKLDAEVGGDYITSRTNERAVMRAMYDNTQEQLAAAGYKSGDTIELYRGAAYDSSTGRSSGDVVNYNGNAIESWSVSPAVAQMFARNETWGEVVSMAVPVSSIVGTARTGFGCLNEGEFIVAGNVPGSKATVYDVQA